jgi:hypothetical protein
MCCFDEACWAQLPEVQKDQTMQEHDAFGGLEHAMK